MWNILSRYAGNFAAGSSVMRSHNYSGKVSKILDIQFQTVSNVCMVKDLIKTLYMPIVISIS